MVLLLEYCGNLFGKEQGTRTRTGTRIGNREIGKRGTREFWEHGNKGIGGSLVETPFMASELCDIVQAKDHKNRNKEFRIAN
jgi:hypothetical protein